MNKYQLFEIPNTFTRDIPLEKQIELGICDWQCETEDGKVFFGRTKDEAWANMKAYVYA